MSQSQVRQEGNRAWVTFPLAQIDKRDESGRNHKTLLPDSTGIKSLKGIQNHFGHHPPHEHEQLAIRESGNEMRWWSLHHLALFSLLYNNDKLQDRYIQESCRPIEKADELPLLILIAVRRRNGMNPSRRFHVTCDDHCFIRVRPRESLEPGERRLVTKGISLSGSGRLDWISLSLADLLLHSLFIFMLMARAFSSKDVVPFNSGLTTLFLSENISRASVGPSRRRHHERRVNRLC